MRLGQLGARIFGCELAVLALLQQGLGQPWQHFVGWQAQFLRFLEFGFSAHGIPRGQQGLAQQETCPCGIRVGL